LQSRIGEPGKGEGEIGAIRENLSCVATRKKKKKRYISLQSTTTKGISSLIRLKGKEEKAGWLIEEATSSLWKKGFWRIAWAL